MACSVANACGFGVVWSVWCRLCRLMQESMVVMTLNRYPGVTYLNRDSLKSLHNILDVQVNCFQFSMQVSFHEL